MSRPASRPNPLDDGIVEKIANRLIGGESMKSICDDLEMPASTMVYQAIASDEEFRRIIARAREVQQDAEIEKTVDIADEATPETVQVAKLRIWARQWRASKLAPKKYGDKQQHELSGKDGGPIQSVNVSTKDPIEAMKVYQRIMRGSRGE